jgi:hypothetical protein
VQCPSGTANSSPIAGLTGNARSATGAQCRSRGPWRRTKVRQRTADRCQCVSARGRNSNAGPRRAGVIRDLEQAREMGICQGGRSEARTPTARCSRHRWSGHRPWHRRSGRAMPKAHHRFLASGAKEGTGPMVKPWAVPLSTTKHQGRQASGTTGAQGATVKITTQRACVSVRDARRTASWTGLKQFQCAAGNAHLQSRKLPISVPRAESARICRGLDVASFYLWLRADEHRDHGRARRCHSKSNEKCRWRPGRVCPHQP